MHARAAAQFQERVDERRAVLGEEGQRVERAILRLAARLHQLLEQRVATRGIRVALGEGIARALEHAIEGVQELRRATLGRGAGGRPRGEELLEPALDVRAQARAALELRSVSGG